MSCTFRHIFLGGLLAHRHVKQEDGCHIGCQRGNTGRKKLLSIRLLADILLRSDASGSLENIFNVSLALSRTLSQYNTSSARERSLQRRENPTRRIGLNVYTIQHGLLLPQLSVHSCREFASNHPRICNENSIIIIIEIASVNGT
jgi:hypothetical protein